MDTRYGSLWKHYRNQRVYQFRGTAVNPNTKERVVVYIDVRTSEQYFRPHDEFFEKFTRVD